jgi:hypothetical protein
MEKTVKKGAQNRSLQIPGCDQPSLILHEFLMLSALLKSKFVPIEINMSASSQKILKKV